MRQDTRCRKSEIILMQHFQTAYKIFQHFISMQAKELLKIIYSTVCLVRLVNYNFSTFSWTFSARLNSCVCFTCKFWIKIVKPLTSVKGIVALNGFLA